MLIINPIKPFYIDKTNNIIRMGNFKDTGKIIEFEDESLLLIFDNLKNPIEKETLINKINQETNISKEEISVALNYLIEENFIIDDEKYNEIISDSRYNRQNLFFSLFNDSYQNKTAKLKNKNILILGLGGIGSNVSLLLSRAGFNDFTLVDFDKVEESNLIRQLPYTINDIGTLKTDALESKLNENDIKITKKNIEIQKEEDIHNEISKADLVLCTLDKPARVIRRLINDLCVKLNKPVIFAGFAEHVAMIGPFIVPGKTACLKCIDKQMTEEPLNNAKTVPSYGPECALISSLVSNEIINYFSKFNPNSLEGKTLMFNFATYNIDIINWDKKEDCEVCK